MATSLVSTGVQFPDSTIQTTAAVPAPGATAQYSVVASDATTYSTVAFNPTDISIGRFTTQRLPVNTGNNNIAAGAPFWSSYYSKWFAIMNVNGSNNGIFASSDGLSWNCILSDIDSPVGTSAGTISTYNNSGQPLLAVDDSNGRFALARTDGSNNLYVYFSDTGGSSTLATSWTQTTVRTGNTFYPWHLKYCKVSTTSGLVLVYSGGSGSSGRQYVSTCDAGSTTWTGVVDVSSFPYVSRPAAIAFQENGSIGTFFANPAQFHYNSSGVISSGWNSIAAPGDVDNDYIFPVVANGYYAFVKGNNLYYSSNGSTWTTVSLGSPVKGVFYTGSNFIAYPTASPYTAKTFISSNNTPVSFSTYNTTTAPQRNLRINGTTFSQRVTST